MNKARRKYILSSLNEIDNAINILQNARDEEYDAFNNFPENFQNSDVGQSMENTIDALDSINEALQEIKSAIDEVISASYV